MRDMIATNDIWMAMIDAKLVHFHGIFVAKTDDVNVSIIYDVYVYVYR